jgi:hypothetical protein
MAVIADELEVAARTDERRVIEEIGVRDVNFPVCCRLQGRQRRAISAIRKVAVRSVDLPVHDSVERRLRAGVSL